MKTIELGKSGMKTSVLAYGCWRLARTWDPSLVTPEIEAVGRRAILAAYDAGYTLFDNSDIYTGGVCERILGQALREAPGMRDQVIVATKGGIRRSGDPYPDSVVRYDFSREYLLHACDASLKRLGLETIDLYMLHREDFLGDPAEVADAFDILHRAGKVRWFGVSNFRPAFVAALQKFCRQPLVAHQLEISLARLTPFTDGSLDQCLADQMTPLAWSPLAAGLIGHGATKLLPSQRDYRLDAVLPVLDEIAANRGLSRTVVALAWLTRHPSRIVPIVGSVKPERIRETALAAEVQLDREEWYRLFVAAHGEPLP
jgi:predicted oxidoreductase